MGTLNSIAEDIAYSLGEQFNMTLRESIKNSIIDYRALFIRQDLENNNLSYTDYLQSFCIALEKVDKSECTGIVTNERVLRSVEKLPKPLRLKNNGRVSFKYVGSVDRSISLTFETGFGMQFMGFLDFQEEVIYYTVINGHLVVLNNLKLCKLLIEEVVADPREIKDCDFPDRFPDDIDIMIPSDMLVKIKSLIKREYQGKIKDGQEITINKDDRP